MYSKTKLYCYLLLKISSFSIVEKMLYFLYYLMFYQKYFELHFTSEERDFIVCFDLIQVCSFAPPFVFCCVIYYFILIVFFCSLAGWFLLQIYNTPSETL